MADKYIIRAEIDATDDMPGMFAREWFDCGVNDKSARYQSADAALISARAAYKGPKSTTAAKECADLSVRQYGGQTLLPGRANSFFGLFTESSG